MDAGTTIVRARVMHTPHDPFRDGGTLEVEEALAFAGGRVLATGSFAELSGAHADARIIDARGAFVLPGLVDTHVHWPQLGIVGAMGLELLDWLRVSYLDSARPLGGVFGAALAPNGTTSALVFGAHFPEAQEVFFEEARASGLRIASGLVVSDRDLLPVLQRTPGEAYEAGLALARRWHGEGRLRYAVSPRFSLSCSEAMLESCAALAGELDSALVTSHINENEAEVQAVAERFPWSAGYLETYDRYGLVGPATVLAHNVHVSDPELVRMAAAGACAASCPASNAFLGSGIFPMRRHLDHGVRFALGTDHGARARVSKLGEGLLGYQAQMLVAGGVRMHPAHLLWLATRAGADALGLGDEIGDFAPGRAADLVLIRPPEGSTLAAVLRRVDSDDEALGAIFTLAREESVAEVRVAGMAV